MLKRIGLLNLLLVFVPLAIMAELLHWSPLIVFTLSALGIVPLAGRMGHATEALAEQLGAGIGGLLNATFGNAAELIIALFALHAGLYDVVKASITGSIIGNILLVLGAAMIAGGIKVKQQRFNRTAAGIGGTTLLLSAVGLVIPAVFHGVARLSGDGLRIEQNLSLEIAVLLFVVYGLQLLFSLKTHAYLYNGQGEDEDANSEAMSQLAHHAEQPTMSRKRAIIELIVATSFVALLSEFLVGAVEPASEAIGMTPVFVGVILVAIVGNAAEHSTAVMVAMKDKMDLALNIAIGSSIQIALFVAPVLVFVSYLFGRPMDLLFSPMEVLAVVLSVGVVNIVALDGESNWMEGVLLMAVYIMLGLAFFFLPG